MALSRNRYLLLMTNGGTVFVVDDDPSARNGLTRLLRTAGYEVLPFESAEDFLADITSVTNGCLVLDARMPGLSGKDLLAELQKRGVTLSLIVVTADSDPEMRQNARDMKASAFFNKPVDGPALLDAIEWMLNKRSPAADTRILKKVDGPARAR